MATDFVDEPKAELRVCSASTHRELIAAVGQTDPIGLLKAEAERPTRDDRVAWLAEVTHQV